jgi:hypothetical protein
MTNPQHIKTVSVWLFQLASACSSGGPIAELEAKVRQFAPWLADDFPDPATFTDQSVRAVAAEAQFWPPYGKLRAFLAAWWQDNRPQTPAGEPDDLDATRLPTADKLMVRRWQSAARLHGNIRALGDWAATPWPDDRVGALVADAAPALAVDLALIRRHAPAGYRWLLEHRRMAKATADKMRWPPPAARVEEPKADPNRRGQTTNARGQPIASGAPKAAIPTHQAAAQLYARQVEATHGRQPGQVSREALAAIWEQTPDAPRPQITAKPEVT